MSGADWPTRSGRGTTARWRDRGARRKGRAERAAAVKLGQRRPEGEGIIGIIGGGGSNEKPGFILAQCILRQKLEKCV